MRAPWASKAPMAAAFWNDRCPDVKRVRSTSTASDLRWLAASAEALTRVLWASRAPAVIDLYATL